MKIRAAVVGSVVALSSVAALLVGASPALADELPPTGAPNWSGLDVRDYTGPVPTRPGTLIDRVPLAPSLSIPGAGTASRILYSTIDQHDRAAVSTGAVFLPKGTAPRGGWPVLAWAHGTVGIGDDCTPSAQPRAQRDSDYLSHWLNRGYAIVATDYAGLGTPGLMSYLNGVAEAHSIVDSVKALEQADLPTAPRWAIIGQSQGAGAAMNAARLATSFTRGTDLDYRGVVATGTPANIESLIQFGGPTFPPFPLPTGLTTYTTYILAAIREARPDLRIDSLLTPRGRAAADRAEVSCYPELRKQLTGADIRTFFRRPISSVPDAYGVLHRFIGTPDSGYDRPIFLGQGLTDTDVPAPSALSLAAQLTANRQPVELHVYPTDHSGTVYASVKDSTPFLARILR
ncbi:alpha/beta hydrolase family protein [Williamsia sp. MIQD14]|uniref:alpha/beta hydrolase family protein n=1 Tax=Williamsia sp. MIQD14 TaxID=3425703 RepID=UPI003DA1BBF8